MKYKSDKRILGLLLCMVFMLSTLTNVWAKVVITSRGSSIFEAPFTQSSGSTGVMVIPVQFSDIVFTNAESDLDRIKEIFRDGGFEDLPSMKTYYENASYNDIYMDIIIQRLVTLPNPRSYYDNDPDLLIWDTLSAIYERDVNVGSFDENYDGFLDALYIVAAGGAEGPSSPWWPHTQTYYDGYATDEVYVGSCAILPFDVLTSASQIRRFSVIHETGHMLGLTDLYADSVTSGTGADTMMDLSTGDLDPFSKLLLGWNQPQVVSGAGSYRISSSSVTRDALMIVPNEWDENILSEYFMVEFVTPEANQAGSSVPAGGGVRVWHVDAATSTFTNDVSLDMYRNSNQSGVSRLLSVVDSAKQWYQAGDVIESSLLMYNDGLESFMEIRIASIDGSGAVIEVSYKMPESSQEETSSKTESPEETDVSTQENTEEVVPEGDPSENEEEIAGSTDMEETPATTQSTQSGEKVFSIAVHNGPVKDPQAKGKIEVRELTWGSGISMALALGVCIWLLVQSKRYKGRRRRYK